KRHQVDKRDNAQGGHLARNLRHLHRSAELLDIAATDEKVSQKRAGALDDEANLLDRHAHCLEGTGAIELDIGPIHVAADPDPPDPLVVAEAILNHDRLWHQVED